MHSVGLKKRAMAYIIDILVLCFFVFLFMHLLPKNSNVLALNQEFDEINDLFFSHKLNFTSYLNRIASVMQDIDKERMLYSILNVIYIMLMFVFIPYKTKKTLGMYMMRIHYDKNGDKITLDDLLIRSMVTCGLLYLLVSLVTIYLLPAIPYFIISVFFAIIQISLVILSIFMVIYRHDNKGLQDLWSHIRIVADKIEVKKWENLVNKNSFVVERSKS